MQITKQHFAVLISLLFAVSLSADPIIHSLETEDHHEIIECQVCESESFKSYDYFLLASYASCLLYTSPSPRDSGESRMPSSA